MVSLNIVFGVNQVIVALLYLILYEINQVMFSEEQYDLNPLTANDALPNYPSTAEAVNAVT